MRDEEYLNLRWPADRDKIKPAQEELRKRVKITPFSMDEGTVAGVDAAFFADKIISVACLFSFPGLEFIEKKAVIKESAFPYIPGYLSFREGPAVIECIRGLSQKPDFIIIDGQGIAHPRGIGIASFIGVLLNIPSSGCAKSRLVGEYKEPGPKKGDSSPLMFEGRQVGAVLRTRDNVKPVFVSPGHLADIESSIEMVLKLTGRFRISEPIRCAHFSSGRIKNGFYENASP